MKRLECFCVLICIVRVVLLHMLKKQDSSFSHRSHAPLRTNLTQAALFEHVKRSLLQYRLTIIYECRQSCHQVVPDFSNWGLEFEGNRCLSVRRKVADASKSCS